MNVRNPRLILSALAVLALVLGAAVGHVSAPPPVSGEAPGQARSPLKRIAPAEGGPAPTATAPDASDADDAFLPDLERVALAELKASNHQLERQREHLRALLASAKQSASEGRDFVLQKPVAQAPGDEAPKPDAPIPFPSNLPEAFTPAGYERVTLAAAEACTELGLEVVAVDCSEFPCIAWTEITKRPKVLTMTGCAPWDAAFKTGTALYVARDLSTEPARRYAAFMAMPDQKVDGMSERVRERIDGMKLALGLE